MTKNYEELIDNIIINYGLKKHESINKNVYKKTERLLFNYLDFIEIANTNDRIFGKASNVYEIDQIINILNEALDYVMYDNYYEIIELFYFDKKSYKEIIEKMHLNRVELNINKQRLVEKIGEFIFSKEFLVELLESDD